MTEEKEEVYKVIQLAVPINKQLPDISSFTPEENYEMLKIGIDCLLRGKKYVSSMSQKELYERTKKELLDEFKEENIGYIEKIQKMEKDFILQKEVMRELKEMEQQRLENEMGKLNERIYDLNVQLQLRDKEIEPEVNKRIMIEREKMEVSINHKNELIQTMKNTIDNLNKKTSIVGLGKIGESTCEELFEYTFKDFAGFKILNKASERAKGDFHLNFDEFDVLADAKNWTHKISTPEITKLKRDLKLNQHINFGWLISLNMNITGFERSQIQFEWIQGNQCICYVSNLMGSERPDEVLRNLWFMCKTLNRFIVEEKMDVSEISLLNDKILNLREKVNPIKKHVKELKSYIGNMTQVCENIESNIRDILNEETSTILDENYQKILSWWNDNIVYLDESEHVTIRSTDIWYKYRTDNYGNMNNLNVTHFKEFLKCHLPEKLIIKKNKTESSAFEIKNIKLRENTKIEENTKTEENSIVEENTTVEENSIVEENKITVKEKKQIKDKTKQKRKEVKVKTEVLPKTKKNFTEEEEKTIIKLYNENMLNIMDISKQINRSVAEIVTFLVSKKFIKQRKDTRGYEEYRNSDLYKEKVIFHQLVKDAKENIKMSLSDIEDNSV